MADEKPAARGKVEIRLEGPQVDVSAKVAPAQDEKIARCAHCARALVPGDGGCAFEWSAKKAAALDAKHEGQFAELEAIAQKRKQPNTAGFGMVGAWVLNGWALQDPGDEAHAWILTDKGRSLTEAEFDNGVAAFFGLRLR